MSDPSRQNPTPSLIPGPTLDTPAARFLRDEHTGIAQGAAKAVLLHELGVIEERAGDEMGAAREYLAAFNAHPQFREPLEGLVRLLERRRSVKNLPKLLDALLRVSEAPEEKARALRKRATFYADTKNDQEVARQALIQATEEAPSDPTAWLGLEVLAGKIGDPELRVQALEARAKLPGDPTWRGLLLLVLSDLAVKRGDFDTAFERLAQARDLEGAARFRVLLAMEKLGLRMAREGILPEALEAQASLIELAMANAAEGDRLGVPRTVRTPQAAGDVLLRAAEARRREGDLAAAGTLLERALAIAGIRPILVAARLAVAEALGDLPTAERMAQTLLGQEVGSKTRASLWMRVAEAAANREDVPGAFHALGEALKADPGSIPARALQIDLFASNGDPVGLASALEAMGDELPTDESKSRAYLLSAYVYAVEAHDIAGAKAALTHAGVAQVPASVLARVSRLLASTAGDSAWHEESIRRLLASSSSDKSKLSLWFELGRTRLLRGDEEGAAKAFESMANVLGGAWLGRALTAYALGVRPRHLDAEAPTQDAHSQPRLACAALDELRQTESDAVVARALTLAAARRADRGGDRDGARQRLRDLLASDSQDLIAAAYLSDLERLAGQPLEAAKILSAAAAVTSPPALAAALHLEAGVLLFCQGERAAAIEAFDAAASSAPDSANALLGWALRCSGLGRGSADARLERASDIMEDRPLLALQRFGVELLGLNPDPATVRSLLDTTEQTADGKLELAAALGRLLADPDATDLEGIQRALERLEAESPRAEPLVAFERLRLARVAKNRPLACELGRAFAHADGSLASALEWLGAAWAAEDRGAEVRARRRLAKHFTGEAQAAKQASGSMVVLISEPSAVHVPLESTEPAARLMNLELTSPGRDADRRAAALLALGDAIADEGSRFDAVVMAGYNLLAHGEAQRALECFVKATDYRDTDLFAWEGLRTAAAATGNVEREAIACSHLGELCADNTRAAEHWEVAGQLLSDRLEDPEQGEICFDQAFERDPTRAVAFDRLFRRVRQRRESDRLLELITRRLEVAEEPAEIAKLYWERARVLRQKGHVPDALTALENVTLIEPDHVGALALKAEMDISQSNFASAAANLSRLAALKDAPAQQRLMSGVAAADLYENKLVNTLRALDVLVELRKAGLSTLPVRERLARAAAKSASWLLATEVLEELMADRPTAEGRIEAARLAMAIWRDKLNQPSRADRAVTKLLDESPADGEALDLVLDGKLSPDLTRQLLDRGRTAVVYGLARDPTTPDIIQRLARIAERLQDLPLRQATLGALKAVGLGQPEIDRELEDLDARVARIPRVAVDDGTIRIIGHPDDGGPLAELFATLAQSIAEALGPSLEALGVTRKHRIDPRSGLPLRNEIASWAGALGLGEFELYVGGSDPSGAHGIAGELPTLVVGSEVAAPLTPSGRQAIVRELFALRRGITVARTRDDTTVAAIVVAACNLAGMPIESPPYAVLGDVQRLLGKTLTRRDKKVLPELCDRIIRERQDAREWAKAALASMYRMAAIAAGDVSLVLVDALGVPAVRLPALVPHDDRARRLVGFVLSPQYLDLRDRLGMGVT